MKTTEWYSPKIKPIRKGVYQRCSDMTNILTFSYWDGTLWYYSNSTIDTAHADYYFGNQSFVELPWRGLISPKMVDL